MEAARGTVIQVGDGEMLSPAPQPLTEQEREILGFERQWWRFPGAKEQAVRERFGLSATHYFQVLNALLDRPEALAHDPMLVQRLRRMRHAPQRARSVHRAGTSS